MKLKMYAQGARRGTSFYGIAPADWSSSKMARPNVVARLNRLRPRIEAMARNQLGDHFLSLEHGASELLIFSVKTGTSKAKRFELRNLVGWVNLFDNE